MCKLIVVVIFILTLPINVSATEISGAIMSDTVFTVGESPYFLVDDLEVNEGATLTIGPGVEVVFQPRTSMEVYGRLNVDGLEGVEASLYPRDAGSEWKLLIAGGAKISHMKMTHCISCISITNAEVVIDNLTLKDIRKDGITLNDGSKLSLSSSTIDGVHLGDAVSLYGGSSGEISSSRIFDIGDGAAVGIYDSKVQIDTTLVERGQDSAVEIYESFEGGASLSIHNSSIKGFEGNDIYNATPRAVDAAHNWWPRTDDPSLYGEVIIEPRLVRNPFSNGKTSVFFLPGFQASRLYQSRGGENQLWEPNRGDDVRNLFMDNEGQPIEGDIYTKDVISELNILGNGPNIYKNLLDTLDDMVHVGDIAAWKSYPYDWRFDVFDVLQITGDWLSDIRSLADHSGAITVIAHSNGGLVAKAILAILAEKEKTDPSLKGIVERVIFVATPHFGTPAAIVGILHGEGQSILGGVILSKALAAEFGKNMLGAYGLLPSQRFFKDIKNIITGLIHIDNFSDLKTFLLASTSSAGQKTPLSENLFSKAEITHMTIDDISSISTSKKLYQIIGEGINTVSGIKYDNKSECQRVSLLAPCKKGAHISHSLILSKEGDGTVLTSSATQYEFPTFLVGMDEYNRDSIINRSHADILEIPNVLQAVRSLVKDDMTAAASLSYVSQKGKKGNEDKTYKISVHSPVSIDVYDSIGRHVGIATTSSNSEVIKVESQIPNSSYWEVGEEKYILLDANDEYTLNLAGTGVGTFILDVETYHGDSLQQSFVFKDIPVGQTLTGHLALDNDLSSETKLLLDIEGDGVDDVAVSSGFGLDFDLYIHSLEKTVGSLCGITKAEKEKMHSILSKVLVYGKTLSEEKKWDFILVGGDTGHMGSYTSEMTDEFIKAIEVLSNLIDNSPHSI